jgi:NAD(P)-dependent dehydrogenase (short-subunit alcohol dehydrogenase family)
MKSTELFNLTGKVAIVTGGFAWLGFDMAGALAEAGADIIITSREFSRAEEAAMKISDLYKVDAMGLALDQCCFKQVKTMAEAAYAWKGHLDILINNAGGGSGKSEGGLFQRSPEDMERLISTNLLGALFCCREVGRYMAQQGYGKIINIASIAGLVGRDRRMYHDNNKMEQPIDYAASKAGIIGMTRDLAGALSPRGVYVNCISPGGFDKGDLPQGFVQDYSEATMLGRMGRMGVDIKGPALFLASAASDYVTGHNLVVDGGFTTWK